MSKKYIQDMISDYIQEGGMARLETVDGVGGVLFMDEGEFIPWRDLGYNPTYGFYRLSHLPGVENQAEYATWSIHPLINDDPDDDWRPFVLLDSDGNGTMLGDRWQVEELLPVLQAFLERGEIDEPVDDEVIGVKYYTIAEACEAAYQYDPTAYPYRTPEEQDRLRRRLQRNIQRGNLWGTKNDPQGRYKIRATAFRGWLAKKSID